jgi:hypothetical protein
MTRMLRTLGVLCCGLSVPALAADAWTITHTSGNSVMSEISTMQFTIANTGTGTGTHLINTFTLQLNQQKYDIDGGLAPPGWVVSTVDRKNKKITFTASGACPKGLALGQAASFSVRVIGADAASDVTGESFILNGNSTSATDTCAGNFAFPTPTGAMTWSRIGLAASMSVFPRTLDIGQTVTVTMTITNRSTAAQSAIAPFQPTVTGSANLGLIAGPTPANLSLGTDVTGSIQWTFIANTRGIAYFSSSARNASVSSDPVNSLEADIGIFPGAVTVSPAQVTDGSTVTVRLVASDNSPDPYQNVVPAVPVFTGTASATLLSGPTPSTVTTLPAGSAAAFQWSYRINGVAGDTFQFSAQATATRAGVGIGSDPIGSAVGSVVLFTVTPSPAALLTGSTNRRIDYTIFNGGVDAVTKVMLLTPDSTAFTVSATPFSGDTSGWTTGTSNNPKGYTWTAPTTAAQLQPGQGKTFSLTYGSVGPVTTNTTYSHRMVLTLPDTTTVRSEGQVTLFVIRTIPEVGSLVAVSGPNVNNLSWNNPADHDGVMILRSVGGAPTTGPVQGTEYAPGAAVGNATVVFSDKQSVTSFRADTGLTNGTRYFYKVYNHDEFFIYAPGNAPVPSGIFSEPTDRVSPHPLWCYSVGLPNNAVQPVTALGTAVFTAGNVGAVSSNITAPGNISLDGSEQWRPTKLNGAVQSRFNLVPLQGMGNVIVTGDQSGRAYAINAANGAILWTSNPIGDVVQAAPAVQLYAFTVAGTAAGDAFRAANSAPNGPRDLILVASRNNTAGTNRVFALDGRNGSQVWVYDPTGNPAKGGSMDIVVGGMLVDYDTNHVFVPTYGGASGNSLRVLDTVTGAYVTGFALGQIDYGVNKDFGAPAHAYVTTSGGKVVGINLATLVKDWEQTVGGMTSYAFPMGNGFIASLTSGQVARYAVDPTTFALSTVWPSPASIPGPTGVRIDYTTGYVYVGDSFGKLHQIDVSTGAEPVPALTVSTSALGMPTIDTSTTPKRLHVGSFEGRLCSFAVPF